MRQDEVVEAMPKVAAEDESGQWRLYEMAPSYKGETPMYRVYHRHDDGWYQQFVTMARCGKCRAKAPEAMDGFRNLLQWEK